MFDKPRYLLVFFLLLMSACGDDDTVSQADQLFLEEVSIDNVPVLENETLFNVDISPKINLRFSEPVELEALQDNLQLTNNSNSIDYELFQTADNEFNLELPTALRANTFYILDISDGLISASGNGFDKINYQFRTEELSIELVNISSGTSDILGIDRALDVSRSLDFNLEFNAEVDVNSLASGITIGSGYELILDQKDEHTVNVATSTDLPELSRFVLSISDNVKGANGEAFTGYAREFYTTVDSVFDFPEIPDEELLTKIQQQTFKYFYDFGHPVSGLTRERNTSGETVTIGGSGFGVMSIIVGIERGFITREEGVERWEIITDFLETKADRFHGVWSHWLNGTTGDVIPFRADDNGGDLVETAFMIQGLLTVRQYLNPVLAAEKTIIDRINRLVDEVEWDWYTQGGQNVLYWHWSPNFGWQKNLAIQGWNESLIVYVLAAASANHSIEKEVYDNGWARQGAMVNSNDNTHYGYTMDLRSDRGGPLFFSHYSFLGLDPRNLTDQYANYWDQNVAHSSINQAYCEDNPNRFVGYGATSWGLTASDNHQGYSAHSPDNDLGVITPTAAISSIPYTPEKSMDAIRHFYYLMGDKLWGEYGFYDAFNVIEDWYASSYLAIDQGPIIIMIENYRTGLLWDLFMSAPEVQNGLTKLDFSY